MSALDVVFWLLIYAAVGYAIARPARDWRATATCVSVTVAFCVVVLLLVAASS